MENIKGFKKQVIVGDLKKFRENLLICAHAQNMTVHDLALYSNIDLERFFVNNNPEQPTLKEIKILEDFFKKANISRDILYKTSGYIELLDNTIPSSILNEIEATLIVRDEREPSNGNKLVLVHYEGYKDGIPVTGSCTLEYKYKIKKTQDINTLGCIIANALNFESVIVLSWKRCEE